MTRLPILVLVTFVLMLGRLTGVSIAQETADTDTGAATAEAQPAVVQDDQSPPAADEADAAKAMDDLLKSREAAPVIEPVGKPKSNDLPDMASPAASIDIDPAVLGIAPGDDPPPLRREGEFIVNRRGRLIRSSESGLRLFVLESDARATPELPLIMQACQLLETMEDTADRRGDATVFILSGQVHTYRGANYLLPTMMKIAADTGNLTN